MIWVKFFWKSNYFVDVTLKQATFISHQPCTEKHKELVVLTKFHTEMSWEKIVNPSIPNLTTYRTQRVYHSTTSGGTSAIHAK